MFVLDFLWLPLNTLCLFHFLVLIVLSVAKSLLVLGLRLTFVSIIHCILILIIRSMISQILYFFRIKMIGNSFFLQTSF